MKRVRRVVTDISRMHLNTLVMVVDVSLTSVVVAGLRRSVDLMQTDRRVTAAVGSLQV